MDPATRLLSDGQRWLRRASGALCAIVDQHAIAQAITHKTYRDDYVTNDFFYYCVAKSAKSLIAINLLLEEGLGEDAQIVLRSAHENYLAISFLMANPERLDDLVDKKVGVSAGRYEHPLNAKGKKDRRRIVDTRTGEVLPFDVPIVEMASKTKYREDQLIHWPLYGFLSEHCHPSFVASGNYRYGETANYSYRNRFQVLQASVYSVYVYALVVAEIVAFARLKGTERRRLTAVLRSATTVLDYAFEQLKFVRSMKDMPELMRTRLARHANRPTKSTSGVQATRHARA